MSSGNIRNQFPNDIAPYLRTVAKLTQQQRSLKIATKDYIEA
jgi:hypothetical protein